VTVLSRMAKLAIASEPTPGTYQPPAFTVIFDKARYHQKITPLRDLALRGSDSWLEDLQQGPAWTEWVIPSDCYPDLIGWYLRALAGPDTCTPGVTTTLTAATAAGATALLTATQPPAGSVLMIGAGDTLEYAQAGTPSGPHVPLDTGLLYAHQAGDPAVSQATHVFAQVPLGPTFSWPRYSLTMDDGTGPLGWPGCVFGSLGITVTKDGIAKLTAGASGFPPATQDTFTFAATPAQPVMGWEWQITTGGGQSTRGISLDLKLTRKLGIFPTVNGSQVPLGIWPGPLQADATYTAIFEDQSDFALYQEYAQDPAVHTLAQPVPAGGCTIALSMPRAGFWDGEPSQDATYLEAAFKVSGIASAVPGPAFGATLTNYWNEAYGP
jgi:hypothetical protein